MRIGTFARAAVECFGEAGDIASIVARRRRPLLGKLSVIDRAVERFLPVGQDAPFLHLARALRDGIVEMLAGVEEKMLEVGFDARCDVGETLAGNVLAGGAHTSEVILLSTRRHP